MPKKENSKSQNVSSLEPILQVWGWILLVWCLYRYFFKLPEAVDELIIKPLIFVAPVLIYIYKKEKRKIDSIGINSKNLFKSLYIGLFFGFVFAFEGIILNYFKYGKLNINPIDAFKQYGLIYMLFISLATAFSEEVLNRGFLFNRVYEKTNKLVYSVLVATVLFLFLHVPAIAFLTKLHGVTLVLFFLSTGMMGILNNVLFFQTGSIIAPILVHIFWNMTVALYF